MASCTVNYRYLLNVKIGSSNVKALIDTEAGRSAIAKIADSIIAENNFSKTSQVSHYAMMANGNRAKCDGVNKVPNTVNNVVNTVL